MAATYCLQSGCTEYASEVGRLYATLRSTDSEATLLLIFSSTTSFQHKRAQSTKQLLAHFASHNNRTQSLTLDNTSHGRILLLPLLSVNPSNITNRVSNPLPVPAHPSLL